MEIRNDAWRGFKGTHWTDDINVRDFIQNFIRFMKAMRASLQAR